MTENPSGLLYTKDHEWVRLNANKATIGITDYAQKSMGDIVFVELPNLDDEIDAGDEFGTVESVKAVSPVYMPLSGIVVDLNPELEEQPELINEDCYGDGWLIQIEMANSDEKEDLLSADEYEDYLSQLEEEE